MVHLPQNVDIEVADVAGEEEGHDLPPPVRQLLVAAGPAVEDQEDALRRFALADEVAARGDFPLALPGQPVDGRTVILGELRISFEPE
jgi:hypothetical protein